MKEQRLKCKELYEKTFIIKNSLTWHVWKRAFDLGAKEERKEFKQKQNERANTN